MKKTRGRTLFIFTSYRNMYEVHTLFEGKISFPLLVQGQKTKRALLRSLRTGLIRSSFDKCFWQGIDVPGEALSCVIIDKLPFEVPDDPVITARVGRISRSGGNAFYEYQVPRPQCS